MSTNSLVRISGRSVGARCGYCLGKNGIKHSYGMWTYRLTVQDYQDLIDRGWRRSGSYCYKPVMNKMCCPPYTIRCDVRHFRPTKTQKRILKQTAVFLNTGVKPRNRGGQSEKAAARSRDLDRGASTAAGGQGDVPTASSSSVLLTGSVEGVSGGGATPEMMESRGDHGVGSGGTAEVSAAGEMNDTIVSQTNQSNSALSSKDVRAVPHSAVPDTTTKKQKSRIKRWTAKIERMKLRAEKENLSFDTLMQEYQIRRENRLAKSREKTLDDYLAMVLPPGKAKHNFEIKLVRSAPMNPEFSTTKEVEHRVYQLYQGQVHGDKPSDVDMKQFCRFLVDSPLMTSEVSGVGLGSFHQQYWLDGELIAVGVIDILPGCVSSVYLFYHPDYAFLSLGTYSALREIAFTQELARSLPSLHHYYMGYYIHSCPKMRYKGQFYPSYLACPETFTWQPLEACSPLLERTKYSRLDPNTSAVDKDAPSPGNEGQSQLTRCVKFAVSQDEAFPLAMMTGGGVMDKVLEWAALVGMRCAGRMTIATN